MQLQKLYLQHFRRFDDQVFELDPVTTIFLAANGFGKTTILEAAYLLSSGKSFRAEKTAETITFGQEMARIYGLLDDQTKLGVTLTNGVVNGRKTPSKLFTVSEAKKRQTDFIGHLLAVCFRPEDLRLIEGSPARRREYLDQPLVLVSDVYRQALKNYQATLIRRNKLLTAIREGEASSDSLPYWDQNLLTFGALVHQQRQAYLDFVNTKVPFWLAFRLLYDHSTVTEERLAKYRNAEIACGHTLIGPHKDDFDITFDFNTGDQKSLFTYGSRGQHRMAVLWLKLAELQFLQVKTQQQPILLLDDILSELDEKGQKMVVDLASSQQTIVTTTDENMLDLFAQKKVVKF